MTIRAVVFDVGGVLEITPRTGWDRQWETRLYLQPGALHERLIDVWRDGSLGKITEAEVERRVSKILGLNRTQVDAFMQDLWAEYLGTLNVELTTYFAGLRPHYRTAILSNSFAGARRREQARYRFGELCDLIVYSHEEGIEKPERRIFELTCERLGVQPAETIFLDDLAANVEAARVFGLHAILCQSTAQAIADIEACLHWQR
jgi:epoxide hydrolase-like predicted phosphatase